MALLQSDVALVMQQGAGEGDTLVKLIEHLQKLILATNDVATINLWLDESIGSAPASAEDVQGLDWNIERLLSAARALAQSDRQDGPPMLADARAQMLAVTGDARFKPLGTWAEVIAALSSGDRAVELLALFGTHPAILEAATEAEKHAAAAMLAFGTADLDGNGRIDASEVAPADRLDFLNATGAYAAGNGGVLDIDLRFAGSSAQALLAGEGVVAAAPGAAPSAAHDSDSSAPVSSGAAVADVGVPDDTASANDDAPSGPAVDARLQFLHLGLDGRVIANDGHALVSQAAPLDLVLIGGEQADTLTGGDGNDTISGQGGNDRLAGSAGSDHISGGTGDDVVAGGDGSDTLAGGDGNDLILGGAGRDHIDGGAGNDLVDAGADGAEVDGGDGDDVLVLGASDLAATGGDGNDLIIADGGTTAASGGRGFDWISYSTAHVAADAEDRSFEGQSGSGGADHLRASEGTGDTDAGRSAAIVAGLADYLSDIGGGEQIALTGSILLGGAGSDILEGGHGNDIIDGDLSLSIRISVDNSGKGSHGDHEITSLDDLGQSLLAGDIGIEQIKIHSALSRSGDDDDVDTVRFSGRRGEYDIKVDGSVTTVSHVLLDDSGAIVLGSIGQDGIDRLTHIERMEFSDAMLVLDFAGMSWIVDGNGDMFAFPPEIDVQPAYVDEPPGVDLSAVDLSYLGDSLPVELIGVHDTMQADYAM
ncbi:MAG: hypothetical protein U1E49_02645 [Hyphomicrobiaceae bacterium]